MARDLADLLAQLIKCLPRALLDTVFAIRMSITVAYWNRDPLVMGEVVGLIPGSVWDISYPMFTAPEIAL